MALVWLLSLIPAALAPKGLLRGWRPKRFPQSQRFLLWFRCRRLGTDRSAPPWELIPVLAWVMAPIQQPGPRGRLV